MSPSRFTTLDKCIKTNLQTRQGKNAKAIKQPTMTAAPAFNVDALLFVEPKKGGLRKRLNRNLLASPCGSWMMASYSRRASPTRRHTSSGRSNHMSRTRRSRA